MKEQLRMASSAPAAVEPSTDRPRRSWIGLISGAQGPLVGLILLCVVFAVLSPYLLSVRNALNVVDQVTVLGIIAIGMTAVIVIGGIDLSVGSILALSMMVMGWLANDEGLPFPLAIVLAVVVGALCGLGNGLLITRAKLPPTANKSSAIPIGSPPCRRNATWACSRRRSRCSSCCCW
jgi:ribose transport system permease protein